MLVKTPRLKFIPCCLEVAPAAKDKFRIEQLLGITVPHDWDDCQVQDLLPQYAQALIEDASQLGWGVWLMVCNENSTLIGDLGFLGTDAPGTV